MSDIAKELAERLWKRFSLAATGPDEIEATIREALDPLTAELARLQALCGRAPHLQKLAWIVGNLDNYHPAPDEYGTTRLGALQDQEELLAEFEQAAKGGEA